MVSEAQDYGRNQSDEEAGTETSADANKCLHWFVYIPSHKFIWEEKSKI